MLYDRQNCDTNDSWNAFKIYRDLGAARSLRQVSKVLVEQADNKENMSASKLENHKMPALQKWMKENDWQNRVDEYDDNLAAMQYKAINLAERNRLTQTVEELRGRITNAATQANDFAALSMSVSMNEMHKIKDYSDANDELSSQLISSHLNIVKTVKENSEIIDKCVNWIDKAYSLTSLIELANQKIDDDIIDV
jgi:hypothetical protein